MFICSLKIIRTPPYKSMAFNGSSPVHVATILIGNVTRCGNLCVISRMQDYIKRRILSFPRRLLLFGFFGDFNSSKISKTRAPPIFRNVAIPEVRGLGTVPPQRYPPSRPGRGHGTAGCGGRAPGPDIGLRPFGSGVFFGSL